MKLLIAQFEIMKEIIIYRSKDKQTQIEVNFENDTVWLTQQQMAGNPFWAN